MTDEIYMLQPPGFGDGITDVCHLHKSLYGLKQAPRVWYQVLLEVLLSLGFEQSLSDAAVLFLQHPELGIIYLLMYVDDIQIAGARLHGVCHVKSLILSKFPGKDLGESQFLLQMAICRNRKQRTLTLNEKRHMHTLIYELCLEMLMPSAFP